MEKEIEVNITCPHCQGTNIFLMPIDDFEIVTKIECNKYECDKFFFSSPIKVTEKKSGYIITRWTKSISKELSESEDK